MAALLLGFAAFAMLEWVRVGGERDPRARGGDDELGLWQLLVAGEVVVWAVFAAVGWSALRKFRRDVPRPRRARSQRWRGDTTGFVLFTLGSAGLLLGLQAVAGLLNPTVLPGQQWKNGVLHAVAFIATVPFIVTLKRVQLVATEESAWLTAQRNTELIRLLRRYLRTATACLGAIVALAVLATGALRNAVAAAGLTALPENYVLLYGAWFTGIVAGIYFYVFGAIEDRARGIVEREAVRTSGDGEAAPTLTTIAERRKALSEEFGLGGDAKKNLEELVAVASPLIGALLSRFGGL